MTNFFGVIKMANNFLSKWRTFSKLSKWRTFALSKSRTFFIKMANFVYQNGELRSALFLKMANFSLLSLNVSLDYTQKSWLLLSKLTLNWTSSSLRLGSKLGLQCMFRLSVTSLKIDARRVRELTVNVLTVWVSVLMVFLFKPSALVTKPLLYSGRSHFQMNQACHFFIVIS